MARRAREIIQGSVVLDSQGLSLLLHEDERMIKRVEKARSESFHIVVSAITILEAEPAGPAWGRCDFVLPRLHIEPVTRELTLLAAECCTGQGCAATRMRSTLLWRRWPFGR
jgi:hypothetical protein